MTNIIKFGLLIVAYLLGSIPWGFVLGKLKGIDIREHGSKNIGATNTGRVLGRKYAIYAYILDTIKGAIFVALFRFVIPEAYCFISPLTYGLAAAIGHTFPIYLKFKGGKAVATGGGVLLGYAPWLFVIGIGVFFLTTYLTKYVSMGSMVAASTVLLISIVMAIVQKDPFFNYHYNYFLPLSTFIIFAIIMIRHKSNIQRIIHKNESKVKW